MPRKLYRFEYWLHPEKTEEWLEEQKQRLSPDAFHREILISYDLSRSGTVFGEEFHNDHILEGAYQFNPDLPLYRALDFGRTCAALFAQRDAHGRFIFFREVILEPSSTTELARVVRELSYEYASHYAKPFDTCDPAGGTASFTASNMMGLGQVTDIKILNEYNIFPTYDRIQQSRNRVIDGVSLIKYKLLERTGSNIPSIRISRQGCPKLIEAFQSGYAHKINRSTQEVLDLIEEKHPYEDVMDCLRYTLMQFAHRDEKKPAYKPGVTKFAPTRQPSWKPSKGQVF